MEFDIATGNTLLARTPGVLRAWPADLSSSRSIWRVVHDLDHLTQIARVLGRAHGAAVGPWRAYLRVVRQP